MELWEQVYPSSPTNAHHIAVTDTFTSDAFLQELTQDPALARRWGGLRQDSGSPLKFIQTAKKAYNSMGIDIKEKVLVFSDSLNLNNCFDVKKAADEAGFKSLLGIGTFLTNDFKRVSSGDTSWPMVMVLKLRSINGNECIKISDDVLKHTGDKAAVLSVMSKLRIPSALAMDSGPKQIKCN